MGKLNEIKACDQKDYYPFGMGMPGRTWSVTSDEEYVFGFNGQQVVREINLDHYSSEFWEYETRIGRRWNIDPNFRSYPYKSNYSCLQNNPIIFIDPLGSTDYFNHNGKFIGSDGIDNGERKMAINKPTSKLLKADLKKSVTISTSCTYYRNLIPTYSQVELNSMKNTFEKSKTSKKEEGFGVASVGADRSTIITESAIGKEDNINMSPANDKLQESGGNNLYDVHLHPPKIRYNSKTGGVEKTDNYASNADQRNYVKKDAKYDFDQPSIVLGYTYDEDKVSQDLVNSTVNTPDAWVDLPLNQIKAIPTVSFFDGLGTIGTIKFSKLFSANSRIEKYYDKKKLK